MEGKQIAGDGLAGMSKNQLYDIMHQMKTLIEQNKEQAKQILIQNPAMTRALFQLPTIPQPSADKRQRRAEQPSQALSSGFQPETNPPMAISQARSSPSHSSQKLQQPKHKPKKSTPQPSQVPSTTQGPQYTSSQVTSVPHQRQHALKNIDGPQKPPSLSPLGHSQEGLNMGGFQIQPPQVTPELEKALLQQVMSLTPEQISMLPPDQRNQILQLQQMLRQ